MSCGDRAKNADREGKPLASNLADNAESSEPNNTLLPRNFCILTPFHNQQDSTKCFATFLHFIVHYKLRIAE